ncbi:SMP-30/gluconolactonase/LRE family protein [Aliiroseovarius subalbicans]|uniref:SMP-30/gluconolactonase/LRE family protein n=1 Tax=Aliiroseovarius subalbicans TaxID=2925840 RepID=UPI001F59D2A9|nr:SMP-30/gluconolactonase/LRE family protein [Aliiroseovarius subalbicans]MCI2400355.1 SMP-30/gluconolactonase/LRE family protein [Aliiroseovarius subalbicans]
MSIFDDRICALGEGPLWHPERKQLFWFDILGMRLLTRDATGPKEWAFDEHVSAAGWVDHDTLLIASETGLGLFDLTSGESEWVAGIEVDDPTTRSNDGRADPFGGFWIGTMGKNAEPGAGAIYRFHRGQVETLFHDITISNAISFAPDGQVAYFTDTVTGRIMRQPLDGDGWPDGKAETFVTLEGPDGAVVDADGCLWVAQWGASQVARYSPQGALLSTVTFPASQISCPAFAGTTLYATSAAVGVSEEHGGKTFSVDVAIQGQKEHRVLL